MDKLLPCPFCGSEAKLLQSAGMHMNRDNSYWVGCKSPGCPMYQGTGKAWTKADAIAAWNRRALSQAPGPGKVFRSMEEFAKEYYPNSKLEFRLVDLEPSAPSELRGPAAQVEAIPYHLLRDVLKKACSVVYDWTETTEDFKRRYPEFARLMEALDDACIAALPPHAPEARSAPERSEGPQSPVTPPLPIEGGKGPGGAG